MTPLALTISDALVLIGVVVPFLLLIRHRPAIPTRVAALRAQSGLEGIAANRSR